MHFSAHKNSILFADNMGIKCKCAAELSILNVIPVDSELNVQHKLDNTHHLHSKQTAKSLHEIQMWSIYLFHCWIVIYRVHRLPGCLELWVQHQHEIPSNRMSQVVWRSCSWKDEMLRPEAGERGNDLAYSVGLIDSKDGQSSQKIHSLLFLARITSSPSVSQVILSHLLERLSPWKCTKALSFFTAKNSKYDYLLFKFVTLHHFQWVAYMPLTVVG